MTKIDIQKIHDEVLKLFGITPKKRYTRGKSFVLPLFTMTDGTYYKHKKNMLKSGKTFLRKDHLDCFYILDEHEKNGWCPKVEDMTTQEIIDYCKSHT